MCYFVFREEFNDRKTSSPVDDLNTSFYPPEGVCCFTGDFYGLEWRKAGISLSATETGLALSITLLLLFLRVAIFCLLFLFSFIALLRDSSGCGTWCAVAGGLKFINSGHFSRRLAFSKCSLVVSAGCQTEWLSISRHPMHTYFKLTELSERSIVCCWIQPYIGPNWSRALPLRLLKSQVDYRQCSGHKLLTHPFRSCPSCTSSG